MHAARCIAKCAAVVAGAAIATAFAGSAPMGDASKGAAQIRCNPAADISKGMDYRQRNASEWFNWNFEDNRRNHYDPALRRIRRGDYSVAAMADIDFTLLRWPNHAPAMQLLVEYSLAGGQQFQFEPPECYLRRARVFAPTDVAPILAEGYLQWRRGDTRSAEASYLEAIRVNPKSLDAHYNLGLLYAEQQRYEQARKHAEIAYKGGFPLPGLRRKLERAGQWPSKPAAAPKPAPTAP